MAFLVHIRPLLNFYFIFALRPFVHNKQTNQIQSKCFSTFYILAFFCVLSLFLLFLSHVGFFTEPVELEELFADTHNISEFLQVIVNIIIYIATIFAGVLYRRNHVRFLNALSDVDKKLRAEEMVSNNKRFPYESFQHIFVIVILYSLFCISGIYIWQKHLNVIRFMFHAVLAWQTVTITVTTIYIGYLAIFLLHRFDRLYAMFWQEIDANLAIRWNYCRLIRLFELYEYLQRCKSQFNDTFGLQLLLNAMFDLMLMTIGAYSSCRQIWRDGLTFGLFYYLLVFLIPHVIKNVFLVHVLHRLSGQVSWLLPHICKSICYSLYMCMKWHIFNSMIERLWFNIAIVLFAVPYGNQLTRVSLPIWYYEKEKAENMLHYRMNNNSFFFFEFAKNDWAYMMWHRLSSNLQVDEIRKIATQSSIRNSKEISASVRLKKNTT